MKTTILEISEPAMLAALAEMKQAVPDAQYWEIVVTVQQKSRNGLKDYETAGVPDEAIVEMLVPKFHIGVHVLAKNEPRCTEYVSGYDHGGMNFEMAFGNLLAALPNPADLLKKKRAELAVLEKQCADLESAVRV